ncbi:AraC family transcriptional regulator [Variovorax paradoxus]|uniref:AraC family transcriptional regulator n=1 Tax=Variovorax paradoxus TaxID=34073 RepID=A0A0D0LAV3_VARPD|nr:helix-turn-helix domain-containing protein [Variovorax paradoxus]KIQ35372.1 AraC family transcriptional regulator [Variovorax paradoxus]
MHKVWLLLFPGFLLVDVVDMRAVFEAAARTLRRRRDNLAGYNLRLTSAAGGPVLSSSGVALSTSALPRQLVGRTASLVISGDPTPVTGPSSVPRLREWLRDNGRQLRRCALMGTKAWMPLLQDTKAARRRPLAAPVAPGRRMKGRDRVVGRIGTRAWRIAEPGQGRDLALSWIEEDRGTEFARRLSSHPPGPCPHRHGVPRHRQVPTNLPAPDARVDALHQWIANHLHEKLSVARLAQEVHMSIRSFVRFYERATGLSPGRGVQQIRLDTARRLIETSTRPFKAIAAQCGYGSQEVMRRAFVRDLRMTPREYRTRHMMMKSVRRA